MGLGDYLGKHGDRTTCPGVCYGFKIALLSLVYWCGAWLGLRLETAYGGLTPIWPPSGLAVAVFLAWGWRYWPVVALGEFVIALTLRQSPLAGVIGGGAQILEAMLALYLLRRANVVDIASSARSVVRFALMGAAIPPLVSSVIGATSLLLLGHLTREAYPSGIVTWWLGDAIGILLLTPILVKLLEKRPLALDHRSSWLLAVYLVLMIAVGFAIACGNSPRSYYLFFLLLPFVVVAAIRFGLAGAGGSALILAVTVFGMRPQDLNGGDFLTAIRMVFVGISAFTGYLVAGFMKERALAAARMREMQAAVEQAKKMQALGTLAGGIAHDFNNIISGVMGYADLALNFHHSDPDAVSDDLKQIMVASRRAADLVRQILAFSRSSEIKPTVIDAAPVVKEVAKLFRSSLPPAIDVRITASATNTHIRSAPTQIHQILMNLLTNAGHAMAKSAGCIEVSLDNRVIVDHASASVDALPPGEYLAITVKDAGTGMERNVMDKIFEPYFTTKPPGEGTGLGLSVVHGIVMEFGGGIEVDSAVGKGTSVCVLLPVVATTGLDGADETRDEPPPPRGTGSILYVEDNPLLTDIAGKFLGGLGYSVTTFEDGPEAAEHFKVNPGAFDLVITDLRLPGFSGLELSRIIRGARADIPIMITTGNPDVLPPSELASLGVNAIMRKPINLRELAMQIRSLLDHGKRA